MTNRKLKFSLIFLFILLNVNLFSQSLVSPEVIATSGGNYQTTAGTQITWTLGEIVTETYQSSKLLLTQGFQQNSYSFDAPQNLDSQNDYFSDLNIFPNPFSSVFTVKLKIKNQKKLKLELFTLEGKKILIQNLNEGENTVYLPYCTSNSIILNIVQEKIIASYKLIKD